MGKQVVVPLVALWLGLSTCGQPIQPGEDPKVIEAAPYRCGAETCRGCCVGDVCRTGDTDKACGLNGIACGSCAEGTTCTVRTGLCESDTGTAPGPYPTLPPDSQHAGQSVKSCVTLSNGARYCD